MNEEEEDKNRERGGEGRTEKNTKDARVYGDVLCELMALVKHTQVDSLDI